MNIFALSQCPLQSAKWHCDKHIVKMPLESTQLLCSVFHLQDISAPYRLTHKNHPCSIWARISSQNFQWLVDHSTCLFDEYESRYSREHKSNSVLQWCKDNAHRLTFPHHALTDFAVAISENSLCRQISNFNELSTVDKYRAYYRVDKQHLHAWRENKPYWI